MKRLIAAAVSVALVVIPTAQVSSSTEPSGTKPRAVGRGFEVNSSNLPGDQAEPFIAVAPRDPRRIVTTAIDFGGEDGAFGSGTKNIYITSDGGRSWTAAESPIWADLTVVADHEGTFWVLGLGRAGGGGTGVSPLGQGNMLARIAPGEDSITGTAFLPVPLGGVARDKPLLSIDNSVSSPTYGRLYAVWDELGSNGYLGAFLTYCDTRADGRYAAERCDVVENWATPFQIVQGGGWIWAPDLATGPNGEVYVVWMDFPSFAIRGTSCLESCTSSAAFGSTEVVAHGVPPDTCAPTGSRVRQTPTLEVDVSAGRNRGRVYVTWVSVEPTGAECGDGPHFGPVVAGPIDSYIASEVGQLPGPTSGTRLYTDGERDDEGRTGADVSDEFFPTVAVDELTGSTWVSFYSTRLDETRRATNLYVRKLAPTDGSLRLSPLKRVSSPIDLSEDPSNFNYGDYAGLDVVRGWPYPVWVGHGLDKDIYTWTPLRGGAPRN